MLPYQQAASILADGRTKKFKHTTTKLNAKRKIGKGRVYSVRMSGVRNAAKFPDYVLNVVFSFDGFSLSLLDKRPSKKPSALES